ncbi:MAG: hypothetical protein IJX94_03635 [Clostridia bacterium]|nr:hypothetical protein [Clostridia bacterium]
MRKTKIVCTLGPVSETKEVIEGLCKAGMNVARLNFSHNTHADHQRRIDLVKEVRDELQLPIAIMQNYLLLLSCVSLIILIL